MNIAMPACLAVSAITAIAVSPLPQRLALVPDDIIVGFDEPDASERWVTVNDNVMGGRSIGGFSIDSGRLVFEGSTNTNGGGFSSIRTRGMDLDLDGTDGLLYRVKGDGRKYIAALRNGARAGRFDVSYWSEFETTGDWQTVRIPFDDFYPTFFGEDITGRAPDLSAEDVSGAAFYIYDKKDGPFRLEIEWIGSYTDTAEDLAAREAAAAESTVAVAGTPGDTGGETAPAADATKVTPWATGVILAAIDRGVPQFNAGNQRACADIYEIAVASLVTSPAPLPGDAAALLESGLRAGREARSHADRAWAYRYAMDAALELLSKTMAPVSPEFSVRAD